MCYVWENRDAMLFHLACSLYICRVICLYVMLVYDMSEFEIFTYVVYDMWHMWYVSYACVYIKLLIMHACWSVACYVIHVIIVLTLQVLFNKITLDWNDVYPI